MPIEILMPALSPTMTEGNLVKWNVKEGDSVEAGDVIAEIETDKATMEVEAVDVGVIGKILVKEGTKAVAVNQLIALLLEGGESKDALKNYKPASEEVKATEEVAEVAKEADASVNAQAAPQAGAAIAGPSFMQQINAMVASAADSQPKIKPGERVKISPVAKRIAEKNNIDPAQLIGSGPNGRIVKSDVEDAIRQGGAGRSVRRNPVEFIPIPNSSMRTTIAKRLVESKQWVPHFYLSVDCELDKLLEMRKDLNAAASEGLEAGEKPSFKLTVNDFVVKASALALRKLPHANASWTDEAIIQYNNVDVSVAVAIDEGLITPIVRNADQKSVQTISAEVKDLAVRAKAGKLQPEEYQGGGFTVSNLGMYGIKNFNAIINPPQSCILAVGAGEEKAIVKNGELVIANVMTVTLSCDHRVVDGAVGAEVITAFKDFIEHPAKMFA